MADLGYGARRPRPRPPRIRNGRARATVAAATAALSRPARAWYPDRRRTPIVPSLAPGPGILLNERRRPWRWPRGKLFAAVWHDTDVPGGRDERNHRPPSRRLPGPRLDRLDIAEPVERPPHRTPLRGAGLVTHMCFAPPVTVSRPAEETAPSTRAQAGHLDDDPLVSWLGEQAARSSVSIALIRGGPSPLMNIDESPAAAGARACSTGAGWRNAPGAVGDPRACFSPPGRAGRRARRSQAVHPGRE